MKLKDLLESKTPIEELSLASANLSMLVGYAFDSIDQNMVNVEIKKINSLAGKIENPELNKLIKTLPTEITKDNASAFRKIATQLSDDSFVAKKAAKGTDKKDTDAYAAQKNDGNYSHMMR
jgi:hypothetical protein